MSSTGPGSRADLLQHITEAEEDENKKSGDYLGTKKKFTEFECPTCSAYNPHEAFGNGDEISCGYCGLPFQVEVDEEAKMKLREA